MDPDYDAEEVVEVIEIDDNEPISDDDAGDEGLNLHFRKRRNLQMSYSFERQYEYVIFSCQMLLLPIIINVYSASSRVLDRINFDNHFTVKALAIISGRHDL